VWWSPPLPGYRPGVGTYVPYDLDGQPPVRATRDLGWLDAEARVPDWSIADGDGETAPVRALTPAGLDAAASGLPVPASLRLLAARPDLQRRIRSAAGCYLDLADAAVPAAGGGHLLHVLSDQQHCMHWLAYLGADGHEAVLTCRQPVGYRRAPARSPLPPVIPLDGVTLRLEVCADSFAQFLYRFWAENEILFARYESVPLSPAVASYAAGLGTAAAGRIASLAIHGPGAGW
jgi:hypothetical protein